MRVNKKEKEIMKNTGKKEKKLDMQLSHNLNYL